MKTFGKKDLFKPGRPYKEYLNEDGSLTVHCITCLHRKSISESKLGSYLCKSDEQHNKCNPEYVAWVNSKAGSGDWNYTYSLWESRFDMFMDEFKLD